jgi:hypothetical protein
VLDAQDLTLIRAELAAMIDSTCRLDRVTDTNGTQTWASGSNVDCIVGQPADGNAGDGMVYPGDEPGVTIWIPTSTAVKPGDRLLDNRTSKTYAIASIPALHNNELLRPVVCVLQRTPGADA